MKRILSLMLACSAAQAHAGTDGNKLYEECSASPVNFDGASALIACNQYIVGVVDGYRISADGQKWLVLPEGATGQQLQDIVLKYLRENPDKRHRPGSALVLIALQTAFPKPLASSK